MSAVFAAHWDELEPLLDRIFDVPLDQRDMWMQRECPDPLLRALLTNALNDSTRIDAVESSVSHWLSTLDDDLRDGDIAPELPTIAGYDVLAIIGSGGMASVFKAERQLPGGPQIVALKLLRINVHDPLERARFLREQRILARLNHPHIAQLLDAGFTPNGTPYLALEFVDGHTLLAHCEQNQLGTLARLTIFIDVCAAVEYAHRSLVVHRDLKPSNVLVDENGRIKLVDFGIAKLLCGNDDDTRTDARRMTQMYAAPEQITGGEVTTAIDVYALGILLGQLLIGKRFTRSDVGMLRGELGDIVAKATQVDPHHRYASVAAFRDDLLCHLRGEPVQARRDSRIYRLRKFVVRHRVGFAFSVALALVLVAATIFSVYQARLARRAATEAQAQTRFARDETVRANAVQSFMQGLFDSTTPGTVSNESADELLARGRERADRDFAANPELRVEVLGLIGDLERRSGQLAHAHEPLETAAKLAEQTFGRSSKHTLQIEYLIAKLADDEGRFRQGATRLEQALHDFQRVSQPASKEQILATAWMAGFYQRIGQSQKAVSLGEETLASARRTVPNDDPVLTETMTNLGWIYSEVGREAEAVALLGEVVGRQRRALGPDHPDVADTLMLQTSALLKLGSYAEAERQMRAAVAIDTAAYSRPHLHAVWHLTTLANVLAQQDRLDEAAEVYRQSIALDRRIFPDGNASGAVAMINLAMVRAQQGFVAEAEEIIRDAIAKKKRIFGSRYPENNADYDQTNLARVLLTRGKRDEAQTVLDTALAASRSLHGDVDLDIAVALVVQAQLDAARHDPAAAVVSAQQAASMLSGLVPAANSRRIDANLVLAENLEAIEKYSAARELLTQVITDIRAQSPPAPSILARALALLSRTQTVLGETVQAGDSRTAALASLAAIRGRNIEGDKTMQTLSAIRSR